MYLLVLFLICFCLSWLQPWWRQPELHADPDAPEEGQADVLLGPLPQLCHHQDVLPRHQVQQEQHRPAGQVVLQLQVCLSLFNSNLIFLSNVRGIIEGLFLLAL